MPLAFAPGYQLLLLNWADNCADPLGGGGGGVSLSRHLSSVGGGGAGGF